jgi:hypothetical protein
MNTIYLIVIHQPLRYEYLSLLKGDSVIGAVTKYIIRR